MARQPPNLTDREFNTLLHQQIKMRVIEKGPASASKEAITKVELVIQQFPLAFDEAEATTTATRDIEFHAPRLLTFWATDKFDV